MKGTSLRMFETCFKTHKGFNLKNINQQCIQVAPWISRGAHDSSVVVSYTGKSCSVQIWFFWIFVAINLHKKTTSVQLEGVHQKKISWKMSRNTSSNKSPAMVCIRWIMASVDQTSNLNTILSKIFFEIQAARHQLNLQDTVANRLEVILQDAHKVLAHKKGIKRQVQNNMHTQHPPKIQFETIQTYYTWKNFNFASGPGGFQSPFAL